MSRVRALHEADDSDQEIGVVGAPPVCMMIQLGKISRNWMKRVAAMAAFAAAVATFSPPADAIIVERIVAIVGDKPILLSELRTRAKPFLVQVMLTVPAGAQQSAAQSQLLKDLLERMIDEELEAQAAAHANISVSSQEIENAFDNIAASQSVTKEQLFKEARLKNGLTEQEYRD